MRGWAALRRAQQRLAARETGVAVGQARVTAGRAGLLGQESRVMRLPTAGAGNSLYDDAGNLLFMMDFDGLDTAPLG